jgi:molybdopterin-guanine dinucleotide biosynthesis protein A
MTTITLDDQLINEVITTSHSKNAQEAVAKILADYLQQQTHRKITDLLAMPDVAEINFDPPRLTRLYHPADLS